jgi:hypothetical protein
MSVRRATLLGVRTAAAQLMFSSGISAHVRHSQHARQRGLGDQLSADTQADTRRRRADQAQVGLLARAPSRNSSSSAPTCCNSYPASGAMTKLPFGKPAAKFGSGAGCDHDRQRHRATSALRRPRCRRRR